MSPYGEKIHQLLRKAGMSQSKLAGDIDVLPNHLSQVINGQKGPFKEDIQSRISDILKLSDVERNELSQLADISRTSFKMRRGARPEEYRIVALFSDHSPFTAEMYIKVARLALAAYEESVPTTRGNTERRVEM